MLKYPCILAIVLPRRFDTDVHAGQNENTNPLHRTSFKHWGSISNSSDLSRGLYSVWPPRARQGTNVVFTFHAMDLPRVPLRQAPEPNYALAIPNLPHAVPNGP